MNLLTRKDRIKKDKKNKFITGEPRYCQGCGKESHGLVEVTKNAQKINQLHYCADCAERYKIKTKAVSRDHA